MQKRLLCCKKGSMTSRWQRRMNMRPCFAYSLISSSVISLDCVVLTTLLSALPLQQKMSCVSPTRRLSRTAVLLSQANLTITRRVTLNPATLPPTAEDREPHDRLAGRDKSVTVRPHLSGGHNRKTMICLIVIVCRWFLENEPRWNTLHFCLFCCPCVCCSLKNKGMVATTGKPIPHEDKVLQLLDANALQTKLAICKCAARTTGADACRQKCR